MTFLEALDKQRWDDHRYYHHSRINQSLHFFSALSFIGAYVFIFLEPTVAVLLAWLVAMPVRQIGHFFFEPRDYDEANQATHEYKEEIKVGYNLRRKVILLTIWMCCPLLLLLDPTLLGLFEAHTNWRTFADNLSVLWLMLAAAGLVGRSVQLFVIRDVQTGIVWFTKILTDPFHDLELYHKAPLQVLRGELFDPIVPHRTA
jgi:hypothetical protein